MTGQQPEPIELDLSALPVGFLWGVATSSFQIEGDAEHRGDSIWDAHCAVPGRIADGGDGRVACDHVHRHAEDVALLRRLGAGAYRFSISWPRVMPGGTGPLSPAGLGFYDRLVDELLAAGIEPWATLYHWDLPVELQDGEGGWARRAVVDRFVDYAVSVHAALGDRVRAWTTLNEPWCSAWLGYGSGVHAPGIRDRSQAVAAAHHLLLGHGLAVQAMRAQAPADHQFGIVLNLSGFRPADGVPEQARAEVEDAARLMDGLVNRWWLGALVGDGYPEDVATVLEPELDGVVQPGDLDVIGAPLDFLGVNYYYDYLLEPSDRPDEAMFGAFAGVRGVRQADPGPDGTALGWPVTAQSLTRILIGIGAHYPEAPPLVVTENGAAYDDPEPVPGRGVLEDPARVAYLTRHLQAVADAVAKGADVRGYFVWTLLDNFEWALGYGPRFGLVRVDRGSLRRRTRRSFELYRDVIAGRRGRG